MPIENDVALIEGACDPSFAGVRAAFEENFLTRGEIGAAVCIYKDGRKVVDLWGGVARPSTGAPWQRDTLVCMMSVTKSMAAIALFKLIDQGRVDLEAPVARYWPEFAQNGKAAISVRCVMSGMAGLLYADAAPVNAAYDWATMIHAYEVQKPEWEPGTAGAYHSISYGFLLGEIVRRVSGRTVDVFFAEEVAGPLSADYHIGVKDSDLDRVADIIPNSQSVTLSQSQDETTKLGRAWRVRPKGTAEDPVPYNARAFRQAIYPSASGHGNARSAARVYAMLVNGGTLGGVRILSREVIETARTESWCGICKMTDRPFRYGVGFFLNYPPMSPFGRNLRAFGHAGAGGALAVADPEAGLAFAYSPNYMCAGAGVGERCEALVESALGKR